MDFYASHCFQEYFTSDILLKNFVFVAISWTLSIVFVFFKTQYLINYLVRGRLSPNPDVPFDGESHWAYACRLKRPGIEQHVREI